MSQTFRAWQRNASWGPRGYSDAWATCSNWHPFPPSVRGAHGGLQGNLTYPGTSWGHLLCSDEETKSLQQEHILATLNLPQLKDTHSLPNTSLRSPGRLDDREAGTAGSQLLRVSSSRNNIRPSAHTEGGKLKIDCIVFNSFVIKKMLKQHA